MAALRCALRAGHGGAHVFVHTQATPILGECTAKPTDEAPDSETLPCPDCGEPITIIPDGSDRVLCESVDGCMTSWKVRWDGETARLVDPFRTSDLTDDDRRDAAAGR